VGPLVVPRLLRTDTERPVEAPVSDCDSRPDTDRLDAWEEDFEEREERLAEDRPDSEPDRADGAPDPDPEPGPAPAVPVPVPVPVPDTAAAGTGDSPQVSQYSSPPPMSS